MSARPEDHHRSSHVDDERAVAVITESSFVCDASFQDDTDNGVVEYGPTDSPGQVTEMSSEAYDTAQLRREVSMLRRRVSMRAAMPYVHGDVGGYDLQVEGSSTFPSRMRLLFLGDAKTVRDMYWDGEGEFESGITPTTLAILDIALRSVGEVVFIDSSWSSLVMLLCLMIEDWFSTCITCVCLIVTACGTVLVRDFPRQQVGKSLYGYNTTLVTISMTIFARDSASYALTVSGRTSIIMANVLNFMLVCFFRMSQTLAPYTTTFPFNIAAMTYLLAANSRSFGALLFTKAIRTEPLLRLIPPLGNHTDVSDATTVLTAIPNGFGQVFFVDVWPLGLVMWASTMLHSPTLALFAFIGSMTGALTAFLLEAPNDSIAAGLWGFNPVLVAMLVGLTWPRSDRVGDHMPLVKAGGMAITLCVLTTFVTAVERFLFTDKLGVPAFTFPFCTIAVMYITILSSPLMKNTRVVKSDSSASMSEHALRHRKRQITNVRTSGGGPRAYRGRGAPEADRDGRRSPSPRNPLRFRQLYSKKGQRGVLRGSIRRSESEMQLVSPCETPL